MKKIFVMPFLVAALIPNYCVADGDLQEEMIGAIVSCRSLGMTISSLLNTAKLDTGLSAAATVGAGVALGAGVKNNQLLKEKEKAMNKESEDEQDIEYFNPPVEINCDETNEWDDVELVYENTETGGQEIKCLLKSRDNKLMREMTADQDPLSKKIDRTNTVKAAGLVVSTATNVANVVLALSNKSTNNPVGIQSSVDNFRDDCIARIKKVSDLRLRDKVEGGSDSKTLSRAERVISACRGFQDIDWKKIDNPAIWSAVASGVGAATGIGGVVTIMKSHDAVDIEQEKRLNKTGNVFAGASAAAGAAATILNASQISAIKKANAVAEKCTKVGFDVIAEIQAGDDDDVSDDDGKSTHISIKRS